MMYWIKSAESPEGKHHISLSMSALTMVSWEGGPSNIYTILKACQHSYHIRLECIHLTETGK